MGNTSDESKNEKYCVLACTLKEVLFDEKSRFSLRVQTFDGKIKKVFLNNIFEESAGRLKKLFTSNYRLVSKDEIKINFFNVEIVNDDIYLSDELESLLVIEPDWLINVTDLTYFDYCPRSLLNKRYSVKSQKEIMIRGSIIHDVFESIIKNPLSLQIHMDELKKSFNKHIIDFAFLESDFNLMYRDFIAPQLNSLIKYVKSCKGKFYDPKTETLIINPLIGLKGRIDILVKQGEEIKAIELKTGKSWGGMIKEGHAFQVQAYSLLMELKTKKGKITYPSIIYSGDNVEIEIRKMQYDALEKEATFNYSDKAKIINLRNELVLSDYLFGLAYEKNINKCKSCRDIEMCLNLFNLEEKHGKDNIHPYALAGKIDGIKNDYQPEEKAFFSKYNKILTEEYRILKEYAGFYLSLPPEERILSGKAVKVDFNEELQDSCYSLACVNTSEIRENDNCLLSDECGPIEGECIEVIVMKTSAGNIIVKLRSPLEFKPVYLDVYSSESTFENNYSAIFSLINDKSLVSLKNILLKNNEPIENEYISPENIIDCSELNNSQIKSLGLSLGLGNYLLIQGPPGTGKTFIISKIVETLAKKNKSVIIACYTHRAIDEVIKKIKHNSENILIYKLGSTGSNTEYKDILLEDAVNNVCIRGEEKELEKKVEKAKNIIGKKPVFIATTNAWLSGRYDGLVKNGLFDVAIIDEAAQVILPGAIGTIRLAEKFILVGDHRQLAPVVQNPKAKDLSKTLFEMLFERNYGDKNIKIMLDRQYRMPDAISSFISKEFYERSLSGSVPDDKILKLRQDMDPKIFEIVNPDFPLTIVDISSSIDEEKPRTAQNETKVIVEIVKEYLINNASPSQIGVIAPFKAQVADIRRGIEESLGGVLAESLEIIAMADTVDRFQGDERDYIIFSLTLTGEEIPIALRDERRFNVAISRAKKKFIGIGDWNKAHKIKTLKNLKDYVKNNSGCRYINFNSSGI